MEKGVKTIKFQGPHYPGMTVPGKRITLKADQYGFFEVDQWLPGTTAEDKKKPVVWMSESMDRLSILSKKQSTSGFKFVIGKKYCGNYYYYIEASLSGNRDKKHNSGLYVKGWCEPKIVNSRWCMKEGGDDVRKTYVFSYGHIIYLHLDTEGLNGDNVTVEVYKVVEGGRGLNDDKLITNYNAKVIDGQINLKMGNTYQWYGKIGRPKDKEEFYVKVKTASGLEVTDGKDKVHARFLRIQNRVVSKAVESSVNNTPTKVGLPDKNQKNTHSCRFQEISVDDNGDHFVVFKEGSTKFKKVTSETQLVTRRIHFAFDKSEIRPEERAFLQTLLDFLLYNQHLDMTLSGHADDRGTLDYNQALSERRAQAVKDFFVNGGLIKNRIKTRGYGEVNPAVMGKTEEAYKKNRRVEIDFSYLEYNQEALIYETIAPDAKKAKEITVNVRERIDKGCFRKEKHDKNIIYINETGGKDLIPKKGDKVKQSVFSQQSAFPKNYALMLLKYLNPFSTIDYKFAFYINSCAYYASKKNATLEVRVYPDIIWIGHFQYNGDEKVMPYYFHQKNFDLEQGITDVLNELKSTIFYKIFRLFPANFIVEQTLLKYIESQAKSYFYGIHTIHNRTIEKAGQELSLVGTQTNIIKQTDYTRFAAAAVIYGFVVIGILVELLMIYLTRGRNIATKLQKFAKMARRAESVLKRMDDAGVELIPPAIAINAGMYYQKQKDGKVGVVYKANLKADPLIALNFKKEFDLLKLITKTIEDIKGAMYPKDKVAKKKLDLNKENNNNIAEYFKNKGVPEIKGIIEIKGDIMFEHNVKYSLLTNTYSIIDKLKNGIFTAKDEVLLKDQIKFTATVLGSYKYEFEFDPLQTSIQGKLNITIQGSCGSRLRYGVDNKGGKGLFVKKTLYCSGIEGTYLGELKIKNRFTDIFDTSTNKGKPVPFTLIEPFEMPMYEIQLFKP
ncbi:OmpA family protein [Chryseobacterium sp. c4a]|uniref:OmpA family protein n=1 Tax=Chryseobacterium sp. c4a TaxID=1573582 RepID=UPI00135996AA|nr:OmpA family protein [Chryseobacterium sp. c4a]